MCLLLLCLVPRSETTVRLGPCKGRSGTASPHPDTVTKSYCVRDVSPPTSDSDVGPHVPEVSLMILLMRSRVLGPRIMTTFTASEVVRIVAMAGTVRVPLASTAANPSRI